MGTIRNAFNAWKRRKNAEGLILLLSKSERPQVTLQTYRRYIDNEAIEALNDYSYSLAKTKSFEEGLQWAEIAYEASLIGGDAESAAECYMTRALILDGWQEEMKSAAAVDQGSVASHYLVTNAIESALQALQIYREIEHTEKIAYTLSTLSKFYQKIDERLQALGYRLLSIISWAELADAAEVLPQFTATLADLYWSLKDEELQEGALLLLKHADTLEHTVAPWIDEKQYGSLYEMFGCAYGDVGRQERAFQYWEQAILHYRKASAQREQFFLLGHMQDYAFHQEQAERAVAYGEACINVASTDIDSQDLASRYHLLGFLYANVVVNRKTDAISALHGAAELYGDAMPASASLLLAARIESELGMIDRAVEDLEKVPTLPGGEHTFWFARKTLAEILWQKRGDLGAAIKHADKAIQLSISAAMSLTTRAASLYTSADLYASIGENQKALNRLQTVLNIFDQDDLELSLFIRPHPLFEAFVYLPPKAEVAFLAYFVARREGDEEEAKRYYTRYLEFTEQEPNTQFIDSFVRAAGEDEQNFLQENKSLYQILQGMQLVRKGNQLVYADPAQAMAVFEEALSLLSHETSLLAHAYNGLGLAKWLTGDKQGAQACLERALQCISPTFDAYLEKHCRSLLGLIEAVAGNFKAAYEQLSSSIHIMETERVSLTDLDQRLSYLPILLPTYMTFIEVCIRLRHFERALEAVESIKSRTFSDLLAPQDRKPIDYPALKELQKIHSERELWIAEHHQDTSISQDWDKRVEQARERLRASIHIDKLRNIQQEQIQNRGLFLQLETQLVTCTFAEIRNLCQAV